MKGYSLHIGVDFVNTDHYGIEMTLSCGEKDAESISEFTSNSGLFEETTLLIGKNASSRNVRRTLDRFVELSTNNPNEEYYFFITATCHGFSLNTPLGGEDGRLEFLCLYDRMVLEHEIREELAKFKSNSKTFIVIGSCFAGGIIHEKRRFENAKQHPVIAENLDFYRKLTENNASKSFKYEGSLCFLGAVEKDLTAVQGHAGKPSPFMEIFLSILGQSDFHTNYLGLFDHITELSHRDRIPVPVFRGTNLNFFSETKPFFFNQIITENNLKTIDMTWNIDLKFNSDNELIADVKHPNDYQFVEAYHTKKPEHDLLFDYEIVDYEEGDFIEILVFKTAETSDIDNVKIPLRLYKEPDPEQQHKAHVVAVDKTNKKKKKHVISNKEVNDEIGATGSLNNE